MDDLLLHCRFKGYGRSDDHDIQSLWAVLIVETGVGQRMRVSSSMNLSAFEQKRRLQVLEVRAVGCYDASALGIHKPRRRPRVRLGPFCEAIFVNASLA